jgi:hypothetical protein
MMDGKEEKKKHKLELLEVLELMIGTPCPS